MNRIRLILDAALAASILLTGSCTKDLGKVPAKTLPAVPSFARDINPFFTNSCATVGCHTGSSPASGLGLGATDAYSNLFRLRLINTADPSLSTLYMNLERSMPPSGIVQYNADLVLKWIQQGAKNN